jgi:hypothetical protein
MEPIDLTGDDEGGSHAPKRKADAIDLSGDDEGGSHVPKQQRGSTGVALLLQPSPAEAAHLKKLPGGAKLTLQRVDNAYDAFAIQVRSQGASVGWVSRMAAPALADALGQGRWEGTLEHYLGAPTMAVMWITLPALDAALASRLRDCAIVTLTSQVSAKILCKPAHTRVVVQKTGEQWCFQPEETDADWARCNLPRSYGGTAYAGLLWVYFGGAALTAEAASTQLGGQPAPAHRCGHWQIFLNEAHIDVATVCCAAAQERGALGCALKASTSQSKSKSFALLVYTADWACLADVKRVGMELARILRMKEGTTWAYHADTADAKSEPAVVKLPVNAAGTPTFTEISEADMATYRSRWQRESAYDKCGVFHAARLPRQ